MDDSVVIKAHVNVFQVLLQKLFKLSAAYGHSHFLFIYTTWSFLVGCDLSHALSLAVDLFCRYWVGSEREAPTCFMTFKETNRG